VATLAIATVNEAEVICQSVFSLRPAKKATARPAAAVAASTQSVKANFCRASKLRPQE
jgi:hypothetical protein